MKTAIATLLAAAFAASLTAPASANPCASKNTTAATQSDGNRTGT